MQYYRCSFLHRGNVATRPSARCLFACADLLLTARTSFHSASWSLCKYLIKALVPRCGCTEDTPCRFRDAGSIIYVVAWLSPDGRNRRLKLREVGPDREHLLTESCSDVHLRACR